MALKLAADARLGHFPRTLKLPSSVLARLQSIPPFEGSMKRTCILEPQCRCDLVETEAAVAKEIDGDVIPQLILDSLIACALRVKASSKCGSRKAELEC